MTDWLRELWWAWLAIAVLLAVLEAVNYRLIYWQERLIEKQDERIKHNDGVIAWYRRIWVLLADPISTSNEESDG